MFVEQPHALPGSANNMTLFPLTVPVRSTSSFLRLWKTPMNNWYSSLAVTAQVQCSAMFKWSHGPSRVQCPLELLDTDRQRNRWVDIWTFWKRPWKDRGKVLTPKIDCKIDRDKVLGNQKKEPVKVLDPEEGTEQETGEGSWLWLSLKRLIERYLEASRSSSVLCRCCHG